MEIRLERTALKLAERDTISIVDGKGARIAVIGGTAWVTQERDLRDVMLRPGQSFILDRNGTAIVEALTESEVVLDAPSGCLDADGSRRDPNLTSLAILGYTRRAVARNAPALRRG